MITNQKRGRPARIIVAEDDLATARLIEVALRRTGVSYQLDIVHDGDEAIAALERNEGTELLLLDLHMPRKNGFEVLEYVKAHSQLRRIPIVVLSSSESPALVNKAYDLHANAYVLKGPDFHDLCRRIAEILQFWVVTSVSPFERSPG
jgi:CheY-like chemotaxis protein